MLLDRVLIIFSSKDIIKRELRFDALALEVSWELDGYTIRKRITVIKLDIALNIIDGGLRQDAEFELVLIIDQVGHVIVVATPGVCNLLSLARIHEGVLSHVVLVQDIVELLFKFCRSDVLAACPSVDLVNEVKLSFDIGLFLLEFGVQGFLVNFETVLEGKPLEA